MGGGALAGDLGKSFFKRRLDIASGKPLFPFDQLDFVVGALAVASLWHLPSVQHISAIILATPVLHLLTNTAAFFLGIKRVWW
ncbi:MAG: CDP-archaeol synthase [Candidatus Rokubacteria bacterium]|nr:CDP-archaeol synthase [Candidatus Rokubacteria bacterium]